MENPKTGIVGLYPLSIVLRLFVDPFKEQTATFVSPGVTSTMILPSSDSTFDQVLL